MNSFNKRISVLLLLSGLALTANLTFLGFIGIISIILGIIGIVKNKIAYKTTVVISIINIVIASITASIFKYYPMIMYFSKIYPDIFKYNNYSFTVYDYICLFLNIAAMIMSAYSIVLANEQQKIVKRKV